VAGCGHGLAPPGPTGLNGRVTFTGSWPSNTQFVAVALFPYRPTPGDVVFPVAYQTIEEEPPGGIFDYRFEAPAGEYGYLVVAWIEEGSNIFLIESWVILCEYTLPSDPATPAPVIVTTGEFERIDLAADLSLVPSSPAREGRRR
jgi:hypothetical protein